ncbi:MAG: acyl--CoA ligase, partial [Nocardioides sp.]|nr:acyl--CoA ligase [Nocardioides sp.]
MTTPDQVTARLTGSGQPFEIHSEEVLGHRLDVFAHRQRSLVELLEESIVHQDTDYLVTRESRLTFAEHHGVVSALATALQQEHGIGKGDRVALCGANSAEWVIAFWATVSLGAIAVGMNSMWAAPELRHGLALTEPSVIFTDGPRRHLVEDPAVPTLSFEQDLWSLVEKHRGAPLPAVDIDEDDPAVIFFTSGTTGRAKGATHSHRNMIAAVWFHLLNDAVATELGSPPHERRYLLATPLFHIAGLHNLAVVRLAVGDTAVVHLGKFDIDLVLRLIEDERVTNWAAVPTMVSRLVEADLSSHDLGSLRTLSVSSAPSSPALRERLREVLPTAGRSLSTSYGLTESSTAATVAPAMELLHDPDSVGRPSVTMEVEVRDGQGRVTPEGTEGEVFLRGAQMMLGYWRNPEATAESTSTDGWFRTGDLGWVADGRLHMTSRRSDLILRGGENVYPAEVEHQLATHEAVDECIVRGVPDDAVG